MGFHTYPMDVTWDFTYIIWADYHAYICMISLLTPSSHSPFPFLTPSAPSEQPEKTAPLTGGDFLYEGGSSYYSFSVGLVHFVMINNYNTHRSDEYMYVTYICIYMIYIYIYV